MTNWKRVFIQIWGQIRWPQSYGSINEIALKKILKKFKKNFFAVKDNTINKKLEQIIDGKKFKMKEDMSDSDLAILSENLLQFYADMFHKSSLIDARTELDSVNN